MPTVIAFEMSQEIRGLEQELHDIDDQMQAELDFIAALEALIVSDESSGNQRIKALEDIKIHQGALSELVWLFVRVSFQIDVSGWAANQLDLTQIYSDSCHG